MDDLVEEKIDMTRAKQLIRNYQLISFDIFDTLILRSVDKPTDIFKKIEEESSAEGFASARIDAERKTRIVHKGNEDVTLDQIYEEIDDVFEPLKIAELQAEEKYTYANKLVFELYDYAHSIGKSVVICSDMYLPKDYLEKLLVSKNYNKGDELFVSSHELKSKASGSLFRHLIVQTGIAPKDILHIGDNVITDGNAVKCGMGFIRIKYGQMLFVISPKSQYK